jgi:hypothetical protein
MHSVKELPLPSPESAKETSQSFLNHSNLAIDLMSQTAAINFWEKRIGGLRNWGIGGFSRSLSSAQSPPLRGGAPVSLISEFLN